MCSEIRARLWRVRVSTKVPYSSGYGTANGYGRGFEAAIGPSGGKWKQQPLMGMVRAVVLVSVAGGQRAPPRRSLTNASDLAFAIRMSGQIDWHAINKSSEIGPVIRVITTQKELVRFFASSVLGHNQPGDRL
jgi:hypothetical protein